MTYVGTSSLYFNEIDRKIKSLVLAIIVGFESPTSLQSLRYLFLFN